jgi:hypothetical protein
MFTAVWSGLVVWLSWAVLGRAGLGAGGDVDETGGVAAGLGLCWMCWGWPLLECGLGWDLAHFGGLARLGSVGA